MSTNQTRSICKPWHGDADVGARVTTILETQGITRQQAADQIGISRHALRRRLTGHVSFGVVQLMDLADVIGVSAIGLLPGSTPVVPLMVAMRDAGVPYERLDKPPLAHQATAATRRPHA